VVKLLNKLLQLPGVGAQKRVMNGHPVPIEQQVIDLDPPPESLHRQAMERWR
jgi:hypothetical protein